MNTSSSFSSPWTISLAIVGGTMFVMFSAIVGIAWAQTSSTSTSAPTCTLSANPSTIMPGQTATLSWTSTGATSATFDQGAGQAASASEGSMTVSPMNTLTYMGTFTGAYGTTTCQATVTVSSGTTTGSATTTGAGATPLFNTGTTTTPITPISAPTTVSTVPTPTTSVMPTVSVMPAPYPAAGTTPAPMVMSVESNGSVLLRAAVKSIGTNSIVVDGWGGTWIIRTTAATQVISSASNATGDVSAISVGDFVGVNGTMARDQIYTVDATLVRDWTTNPLTVSTPSTTTTTTTGTSTTPTSTVVPLYTGTASAIGADSFTLTSVDGTEYTVMTDSNTVFLNTARATIAFSDIESGDSIRVNGSLSGSTITATVVRDISR